MTSVRRSIVALAAAAAVRGQLDAGLRSRIRFPLHLQGHYVAWEGHPRVGLGNVLAGFGDLYYKAQSRKKTILVGLDHAITRDLSRFFTLGFANETGFTRPSRVRSGLVYDGFEDLQAARRFNVSTAHCRPGKLQVKRALDRESNYTGSLSFEPETSLPCGFREALQALIRGPGIGFRRARTKLRSGWDGDPLRLETLLTQPPSSPIYVAAVHVRAQLRTIEDRASLGASERGTNNQVTAWLKSAPIKAYWAGIAEAIASLCRGHAECPVFVSSESSLVRKHLAEHLRRADATLAVDFIIGTPGVAHLIDHLGDKDALTKARAMGHSRAVATTASSILSNVQGDHRSMRTQVPYLDWWALANSADIVVRCHVGCHPQASTISTKARAWGLDVERASKRAMPDFDGLV